MIRLKNIHSLSDFQRNAKKHIQRIKNSGEPEVLTINGEAEVVVLSAEAYQKLVAEREMAGNLNTIHQGMVEALQGKGLPAAEALRQIRARIRARARKSA